MDLGKETTVETTVSDMRKSSERPVPKRLLFLVRLGQVGGGTTQGLCWSVVVVVIRTRHWAPRILVHVQSFTYRLDLFPKFLVTRRFLTVSFTHHVLWKHWENQEDEAHSCRNKKKSFFLLLLLSENHIDLR